MRVSFNQTTSPNVRDDNGYGYAAKMCQRSLRNLGHEVTWRDETADVEINFIQPDQWVWTGPYRIGYLPWESTTFRPGWVEAMNECDEVWTPAPRIAEWMVDAGVTKDVKVYEHGVESLWSPVRRNPTGTFHMLHHGAEALRKGGNDIIQTFMSTPELWDGDADLWLKMLNEQWQVHDTKHIKLFKSKMPIEDLVSLYHRADLFTYPSWGEGFGLTPLQAMATGMPVLITEGWAPYERFLGTQNIIKSSLVESPWQEHHPGMMYQPDRDDFADKLLWHFNNREFETQVAYSLVDAVVDYYNWDTLTEKAFAHLV